MVGSLGDVSCSHLQWSADGEADEGADGESVEGCSAFLTAR
ncbi:hypothetical protein [Streptomyces sp. NPDC001652]